MTLATRIAANRRREARYSRAETTLRQIRLRIFDYADAGPDQEAKARRVMDTCQRILAPRTRARRATVEAARLERTPSAYEPGSGLVH
jgi:hypothetical protein